MMKSSSPPRNPSQTVVTIIKMRYMFLSRPSRSTGMRIDTMMMTPPMDGTPTFFTP